MSNLENEIWELVHNWCNEQSCEIPDFNRRVLMERILALSQTLVSGRSEQLARKSCNHACSPSDFYKGGKCDKMGCYEG